MDPVNIGAKSEGSAERELSNFAAFGFWLDGTWFASREAFIMFLMLALGTIEREQVRTLTGFAAKRCAKFAKREFIWWNGQRFLFRGPEHVALIERGIRACFEQNPELMQILLSTAGRPLIHDLGHPERPNTSLPAKEFCAILTAIREENLAIRDGGQLLLTIGSW